MQTFNIFGLPKVYLWECLGPLSSNLQERTKAKDITWDVLLSPRPSPLPFYLVQAKAASGSAQQLSWGWVYPFQISSATFSLIVESSSPAVLYNR